jgi:hypothetical protein
MEAGVEDGDMRHGRQDAARLGDAIDGGTVVERRELDELLESSLQGVVDQRRFAELPAVHDTVRHGLYAGGRGLERLDRATLVAVDDVELEARRAGVDDENRQPGQAQSRISGGSSPYSRPYARARRRLSTMSCRR